ncbi:MAG: hotdog fold thioesterase [Flavobacteriales bacterium]
MFPKHITPESINAWNKNTLIEHIGIEFTEIGNGFLIARMPVDNRTHQPMGLLHGGASVALAETIGSVGSHLIAQQNGDAAVGLDINANHVGGIKFGWVYGKGVLLHQGKTTHVWEIRITDENEKLICISRLTMMIIKGKK